MHVTVDLDVARWLYDYNPDTGVFLRKVSLSNRTKVGEVAGTLCPVYGYRVLYVAGQRIRASRLAWALMTGEFPSIIIDHINGIRDDDRFCNLRLADSSRNGANMVRHRDNKTGFKGVVKNHKKFTARIQVKKQVIHLGSFETPEEAHQVYLEAARKYFGEYSCDGNRA